MIPAFWVFVAERGHSEAVFLGADLGVGSGIENFLTIADHLGGSGQIFVAKSGWSSLERQKSPLPSGIRRGQHIPTGDSAGTHLTQGKHYQACVKSSSHLLGVITPTGVFFMQNFPLPIKLAADRLERVTSHPDLVHGGERCRSARSSRRAACLAILRVFLRHFSIQHQTAVVTYRKGDQLCAVPATHDWLAQRAGLTLVTFKRAFYDLQRAGFVSSSPQMVRTEKEKPGLLVAATIKTLTSKFWGELGLTKMFRKSVGYAIKKSAIKLKANVFRRIGKVVYSISGRITGKQSDRKHLKKLNYQVAAINCLMGRGMKGCASPTCGQEQQKFCRVFRC